jgi:L-ascorbate metabolism protein UlaG (beta-lactamase superfamily)
VARSSPDDVGSGPISSGLPLAGRSTADSGPGLARGLAGPGAALALAGLAGLAGAAASLAWAARGVPSALGGRPQGDRLERIRSSPQYQDGAFRNAQPPSDALPMDRATLVSRLLRGSDRRKPGGRVPLVRPTDAELARPAVDGVRATWLGHASVLLEISGRRVLLDPVFSDRCSPSQLVGPRRLHPVPITIDKIPPLDAIVISHDHYDHLDEWTIRTLATSQDVPILCPLGIGAHLERWGVPTDKIIELDWDETATVAGLGLTATGARHFSGRFRSDNATLWSSWVISGTGRRVFYTGDSGYFDGYSTIGTAHGPFDLTLIQIGAYSPYWPDIHMTPEEGVATHKALRGGLLVPVHWCTFNLAFHDWSEPVERLAAEAEAQGVRLVIPRPGQPVDVDDPPELETWWRDL